MEMLLGRREGDCVEGERTENKGSYWKGEVVTREYASDRVGGVTGKEGRGLGSDFQGRDVTGNEWK